MSNYRGREPGSHVFEWIDAEGTPRYVGHGSLDPTTGEPPWARLWASRERQRGALGEWLRSLSEPPERSHAVPSVLLTASTAAGVARLRRGQLRRRGLRVLSDRVYSGSGRLRPACGCRSIRQLARVLGVSRRLASRYAGYSDYDDQERRRAARRAS